MGYPVILSVDDVVINLRTIKSLLQDSYTMLAATSGDAAIKVLENNPNVDLILLDVMMSPLDGYQTCKLIKDNPKTSHIPIIFLTGQADDLNEEYGLKVGAVDYITKPANPAILKARVSTHIKIKQQQDLLTLLSTTDGLTGLYNKRQLDILLEKEWNRSIRSFPLNDVDNCGGIFRFAIGMIDIDYFKKFNDTYGHQSGDEILELVAKTIQSNLLRVNDICGRQGGEEFLIILPNVTHEGSFLCANKIRKAVEELNIPHSKSEFGKVTISVGIASVIPCRNRSFTELVKVADNMLYKSKESGRNKVSAEYVSFIDEE